MEARRAHRPWDDQITNVPLEISPAVKLLATKSIRLAGVETEITVGVVDVTTGTIYGSNQC
jgi:hypothetical protein